MTNNIFDLIDTGLNKLDKTLNNRLKDTFLDNFIQELRDYMEKYRSYELFKQLPKNTYFHLTGQDDKFLECMAYGEKKVFYVPKDIISGRMPEIGEALAFNSQNMLTVNYGGIPLWEYEIPKFKSECTIAKWRLYEIT